MKAKKITDLPVDVLSHVFDYLPLAQVLHTYALVSKVFYKAHRQHCRSKKQLTLIGHYIFKGRSKKPRVSYSPLPQTNRGRKREFFSFARSTGIPSSPTINFSTAHLKLVAGQEEKAYAAIGDKFKSITHLELFQLAFEQHYKLIAKMISAWGSSTGSSNMLADLKIFFSKEMYAIDEEMPLKVKNNNSCIAYILAMALTPDKTPALRQLTLKHINETVPVIPKMRKNYWGIPPVHKEIIKPDNHNGYHGPYLKKIDLSHLETLNAPQFEKFQQNLTTALAAANNNDNLPFTSSSIGQLSTPLSNSQSWTALRDLTIDLRRKCDWSGLLNSPTINQLTSLTIFLGFNFRLKPACHLLLSAVFGTVDGRASSVSSLTLKDVCSPFTKLVRIPSEMSTKSKTIGVNHQLEHLRVDFKDRHFSQLNAKNPPALNEVIRFLALTSLHIVKSFLLHSNDLSMAAYAMLFPNVVHLRLDDNYYAQCFDEVNRSRQCRKIHCLPCCELTWSAVRRNRYKFDVNNPIISTTDDNCKAAFIARAMNAWPNLAKISLQIEDFYEKTLDEMGAEVKYLYKSETVVLRDEAGMPVPEDERVWNVKNVFY